MATLACKIDASGITSPDYDDILAELQNAYYSIYGTDADLDSDSQDGQFLAILAQAIYDTNQTALAVYNAYSPATAQGSALSSDVKINGLTRQTPSNSTDVLTIVGVFGTVITGGQIGDNLNQGTVWDLPPSVTIPISGTINVTITCETPGVVSFAPGQITDILTPTRGWQTATNVGPSAPGNPVETDSALRQRQAKSTALPALTVNEGIFAAVAAIPGVSLIKLYENPTDIADANGIPPHAISIVLLGGDLQTVANTIALKKTPGTNTFGNTSELTVDANGVPLTINFSELIKVPIAISVTIKALSGYTGTIGGKIQAAVLAFIASLDIGENSYLARLYSPANLGGTGDGATFYVTAITQAIKPGGLAPVDLTATYDELFTCQLADVAIVVT